MTSAPLVPAVGLLCSEWDKLDHPSRDARLRTCLSPLQLMHQPGSFSHAVQSTGMHVVRFAVSHWCLSHVFNRPTVTNLGAGAAGPVFTYTIGGSHKPRRLSVNDDDDDDGRISFSVA